MDEELIVTTYVVIADVLAAAGHHSHPLAGVTDAEVLTVAVVAAACFQNHQAVALAVMHKGYLSGKLSVSRFNRRLHALLFQMLSEFEWSVLAGYQMGKSYREIARELHCKTKSVDNALMRVTDLFLCLPGLPLLLLIVYLFRDILKKAFGPEAGVFLLIVAVIGGLRWMPVARLVRAQFLSLREKEFVEAARGLGARPVRQVWRHILPNAMGPVIVAATIDVAAAIIAESSLSFERTGSSR